MKKRKPKFVGTGIHGHQLFNPKDLVKGDTFFDADFGDMIWNGKVWVENTPEDAADEALRIALKVSVEMEQQNRFYQAMPKRIRLLILTRNRLAQLLRLQRTRDYTQVNKLTERIKLLSDKEITRRNIEVAKKTQLKLI
jgi:hypothetical protein